MKSKTKIRIVKFERAIACQILEMDERFRRARKNLNLQNPKERIFICFDYEIL
jgi:hypothetical protein